MEAYAGRHREERSNCSPDVYDGKYMLGYCSSCEDVQQYVGP